MSDRLPAIWRVGLCLVFSVVVGSAWAAPASGDQEEPTDPAAEAAPSDVDAAPADLTEADVVRNDEGIEEVLVIDTLAIVKARQEVVSAIKGAGFRKEIRREGRLVLRHDQVWKGEVVLYDDGRVSLKRQPIQFDSPLKGGAERWLACILVPLCIKPNGQIVSPRKLAHVEEKLWVQMGPEVRNLRETIATAAIGEKVHALPEKMQRLWDEGVPLSPEPIEGASVGWTPATKGLPKGGGAVAEVDEAVAAPRVLATYAERRQALMQYWDTRTNTAWGEQVRTAVEAFLRGVVQRSDDPFTDEELAAFNAQRLSDRPLVLVKPADPAPDLEAVEAAPRLAVPAP